MRSMPYSFRALAVPVGHAVHDQAVLQNEDRFDVALGSSRIRENSDESLTTTATPIQPLL